MSDIVMFSKKIDEARIELYKVKSMLEKLFKHLDDLDTQNQQRCPHHNKERDFEYGSTRTTYTCLDCGAII